MRVRIFDVFRFEICPERLVQNLDQLVERSRLAGAEIVDPALQRLEPTQTRDKYRRLLAYLYVSDNENLNLSLVHDGQAYADRRFPHTLKPQFEQEENDARTKKRGLWKEVTESQMPAWRQKWLAQLQAGRAKK